MRIQESRLLMGAIILLLLACYLAAVAAPLLDKRLHGKRAWPGFYVLVAPVEQASAAAEQELARFGRLISAHSSMVELNRFDGMEQQSVAQLEERLDPLDLRYDDYLRRVGGYFNTAQQSHSVVYLQPSRSLGSLLLWMWSSKTAWRLADPDPIATLIPPLLFVSLLLLTLITAAGQRWTLLATALPWMAALPFGGPALFIAAVAQWWSGNYVLRTIQQRRRWRLALWALSVTLLTVPLAGLGALIASVGLLCAALLRLTLFNRWNSYYRRPSMRAPIRDPNRAPIWLVSVVMLTTFSATLLCNLLPATEAPTIPRPSRYSDLDDLSFPTLMRAWERRTADELPSISDYLAHRAYQQALPYGRGYFFPDQNETVELARFEWRAGQLHSWNEVQLLFDSDWFARQFDPTVIEVSNGVPELLLAQGRPISVQASTARSGMPTVLNLVASILLICYAVLPTVAGKTV